MANCNEQFRNTGSSSCKIGMGRTERIIILPNDAVFTGETPEELYEFLMNGIHNNDKAKRFYPLPMINGAEPTVDEPISSQAGYGDNYFLGYGAMTGVYTYPPDFCLSKRLTSFNGSTVRILLIDNKKNVWGAMTENGFTGFQVQLFNTQAGLPNGTEQQLPSIRVPFTSTGVREFNELLETFSLNVDPSSIEGLTDVSLIITKIDTSYNVKIYDACDKSDVTEKFSSTTGSQLPIWIMNGQPLVTGPTYSNNTFIFSDLTTGGELNIAPPETLYIQGIKFKESISPVEVP